MHIYCIRNLINTKCYIGQSLWVWSRFAEHKRGEGNKLVYQAIQKYGIENFSFEVIDTAISLEELNQKEIHWIAEYDSLSPNGYNLTSGGSSKFHTPDSIERNWAGKNNPMYGTVSPRRGVVLSEDIKEKIRINKRKFRHSQESKELMSVKFSGSNNGMFGKKHSAATKQKIHVAQLTRQLFKELLPHVVGGLNGKV